MRRFSEGDAEFAELSSAWGLGVRQVFRDLPDVHW
jgi:predicted proteasome-type protease